MKRLSPNSTIYVVCPASIKTGGPELLHQLVFHLNSMGKRAYITYFREGTNITDPTVDAFKKYVSTYRWMNDIKDNAENLIIVPEAFIGKAKRFKKIQKAIWWLSVDNMTLMKKKERLERYGFLSYLKHLWLNDYAEEGDIYKVDCHFYQSYYAQDYLRKIGVEEKLTFYLSDYVNDIYLSGFSLKDREDIVIYNPKKGMDFTKRLIQSAPQIRWIPIQNMTNDQVRALMNHAKVYIDFGNHPGKDRIPREAAMSGCCVITNRRGSAAFYGDVPIFEKYKIDDRDENIPSIIEKIQDCLANYEIMIQDFSDYRMFISQEKAKFASDVKKIFT